MKLEVRRSAAAVVSCVILLLLGGCRSDADFSPDAEFVDFSYEVPEFRTGKLEKASDARLRDYTVLPSASGPAVLTTLKRDTDAGNRLCCFSARLTNLDKQGAVRSERDLVTQHAGTHGLTVLPISLDAQSIKLAIVEEMLVQIGRAHV